MTNTRAIEHVRARGRDEVSIESSRSAFCEGRYAAREGCGKRQITLLLTSDLGTGSWRECKRRFDASMSTFLRSRVSY